MRPGPARWRREAAALTRQPRPLASPRNGGEPSARPARVRCCAVAVLQTAGNAAVSEIHSHRLEGDESLPHARQDRQASSVSRPLEGRQRPKKPGPSLLQVASPVWRGAPVCLRLPVFRGRLTGLLSRSPPTDTRPQARAYWAFRYLCESFLNARDFFAPRQFFSRRHKSVMSNPRRDPDGPRFEGAVAGRRRPRRTRRRGSRIGGTTSTIFAQPTRLPVYVTVSLSLHFDDTA